MPTRQCDPQRPAHIPLVVVAGLSGAGKSTVLNVFEDMGFFCVDGLPVKLVGKMVLLFDELKLERHRGLALGLDVRQTDFAAQWEQVMAEMHKTGIFLKLLFLEARDDVLIRRYATTRRPHPLETLLPGLDQAIARERTMLEGLRLQADLIVDTSDYSIHDLRRFVQEQWTLENNFGRGMRVHLISFGFKYGVPLEADLVFDLRFLPNPYFNERLRPLSGMDGQVANYVLGEDPGRAFLSRFQEFMNFLLPLYALEGRYRLTMALGCTGGRHRSVVVTQALLSSLTALGFVVSLEHRHLDLG
ncbi:MAG TPA: RNase adapter RapZ [Desulfonatronum sp.]|nr:RNase adapter RapZ [Desulfonatronum sp.]